MAHNWFRRIALVLLAAAAATSGACASTRTINELLADPGRYRNRSVTLSGEVVDSYSVANKGAYRLDDGTGQLWIVSETGVPRRTARVSVKGRVREGGAAASDFRETIVIDIPRPVWRRTPTVAITVATTVILAAVALTGQTKITAPNNKYTLAEDVQLGRQAATEVEQELPMLRETAVTTWLTSTGERLVRVIPPEFRHSEFRYSFKAVNLKEINAFALPGGPMYVHRGMIAHSRTQGEAVSVLAHEISHVALRHGTAQATQATKYEIGALAGAVLGSIIGGKWGGAVAEGTQFGLGTAFLRFSREYERQADLLGSHIMAAAGYDPRDMASMFRTIEQQSGSGGPEWLSSHPNPGNRSEAIAEEATLLRIRNPVTDSRAFAAAQARLRQLPTAPTSEEATTRGTNGESASGGGTLDPGRVAAPASSSRTYTEGDVFRVSVPSNWQHVPGNGSVTFAPAGAIGDVDGQSVVTHGMVMGVASPDSQDLAEASDAFVVSLGASNPRMRREANYSRTTIGGRRWLRTTLVNRSAGTSQDERIAVFTVLLNDGSLFYALGVAPLDRFAAYDRTFRKVVDSIQFAR